MDRNVAGTGGLDCFSSPCVQQARGCSVLDLGALPGIEDAVRVDTVVEMGAELVEDRASVAESVGRHGVGPLAPAPVAAEVGEWGCTS